MLRAGWAHVSSCMLSLDSACVHRTLLPTREAVVCKEEYRNLQQSLPMTIVTACRCRPQRKAVPPGPNRRMTPVQKVTRTRAVADGKRSIQLSDAQLETIVAQVAQRLLSHAPPTSQPSTSVPAAPTTTSRGEDSLTTCLVLFCM